MTVGGEERSAVAQFQPEILMNGEGRARTAAGLGTVGMRWVGGGGGRGRRGLVSLL